MQQFGIPPSRPVRPHCVVGNRSQANLHDPDLNMATL
jgi:hypothetical protein